MPELFRPMLSASLGDAEDVLRRPVVILHEMLHAGQHLGLGVAEALGNLGLQVEAQDIGGAGARKVQLVPYAKEEVVGAPKGLEVVDAEIVLGRELVDRGDVELHPRHPNGVLVVAETADAILDVRFLVEDRVGILAAAVGLILEAGRDIGLGFLADVIAPVGLGERVVELVRPRDQARLEQRRLSLDFLSRLGKRLVDGPRGMPDLQPAIPQEVENLVRQVLLQGLRVRRLGLGREQEHHVHVAQRRQLGPPVATQRHQRHRRGRHGQGPRVALDRVVEEVDEELVDGRRPLVHNLQSGPARGVPRLQGRSFLAQEVLAGGQPVRDRNFPGKKEFRGRMLVDFDGHRCW